MKLKVIGPYDEYFGGGETTINLARRTKLKDIIEKLPERAKKMIFDEERRLRMIILLNNVSVLQLKGLETEVEDTDCLVFLPIVGGG